MKRARVTTNLRQASDLPWTSVDFPSSLETAQCLEEQILQRCRDCFFSDHDIFAMKLALEEALVNAVKHGNRLDPAKHVRVQYRVTTDRADVAIEDEGPGFNPAELPDPTLDENLEATHGRGILLMRAYMSNVVFNPAGNRVTLTKFSEGCPGAARRVAMG